MAQTPTLGSDCNKTTKHSISLQLLNTEIKIGFYTNVIIATVDDDYYIKI